MKLKKLKKSLFTTLSVMMAVSAIGATNVNADTINVVKIAGRDRVKTSIESSKYVNSNIVVIANAYNFADSLSAFNLASKFQAKLLLVDNTTRFADDLKAISPNKVYIVGGKNALGVHVETEIDKITHNIQRVQGRDRYATNAETLRIAGFKNVGVADGRNYPDALSASGLLKKHNMGLMLVNGSLPYKTDKTVKYTFGGRNSVNQNGGVRLEGRNRYLTNEAINKEFNRVGGVSNVAITTGEKFADALSSINILNAKANTSIMLVGSSMSESQKNYIKDIKSRFIIGGMLSTPVENIIYGRTSVNPKPNPGPVTPPKPNPGPVTPPKPAENKYTYIIKSVDNNSNLKTVVVDKLNYESVEKSIPSGYSILSTREEVNAFRVNGTSVLYVKPSSMKYFATQQDYDRYIFNGLKNQGLDSEKILLNSSVTPKKSFGILARGLGFSLSQYEVSVDKYKVVDINICIEKTFYTMESYSKEKYVSNLAKIDELITKSGADKMPNEKEKSLKFARFLMMTYPYNENITDNSAENHRKSRSPYSITDYNTAVCEGYVYTFNQAMLRMGIKSFEIHDEKHMMAFTKTDGTWHFMNVTGFAKNNIPSDEKTINDEKIYHGYIMKNPIVGPRHVITPTDDIEYLYR
ncbi:N-acetylmuramoyl-L-alanine amidase LytC precursor [Peptostreptococcus anaerobius]|uniref:N-acetylmuramoyl-L-alanine amidase LytC n=4 Tax=Peptostreptococcus anaerobius TaxID=1261 RepID=A0A379CF70_9FIRM|nr:cell wall-binding repeat-containing protein [Peptostreptococcus anaerobius]SUB60764.1 N-acetylmuramoyl-L-alanine amidase LytC precursor [Peptostreptococcus anaerobius]